MPIPSQKQVTVINSLSEENDNRSEKKSFLRDEAAKSVAIKTEAEIGTDESPGKHHQKERSTSVMGSLETRKKEHYMNAGPMLDEEEERSATVVMPSDGGWGWVIVAASFVCNFIVDGILYSFGVIVTEISEKLSVSESKVALVGSLLSGCYLLAGPFVSALSNRYGFRKVTIIGSFLAAVGFGLSSIATSIEFLLFTYSIVGGVGFGMIYSPSIIIVGFYFEKWRALATGIAVCGSGIGTFVIAPLTEMCINNIKWQGALIVHAGILLICGLCGILYRPLRPVKITLEKTAVPEEEYGVLEDRSKDIKDPNVNLMKFKKTGADNIKNVGSTSSLKSNKYPTAAEVLQIVDTRKPMEPSDTAKISKSTQSLNIKNLMLSHNEDGIRKQKRFSVPEFQGNTIVKQKMEKKRNSIVHLDESNGIVHSMHKKKPRTTSETFSEMSSTSKRSRRNTATSVTECTIRSRRGTITQMEEDINRPIYRDDIFFSGSLNRIPMYKAEEDSMSYRLSVIRLPTKKDVEEENEFHCFPEAVKRAIGTMLDLSLLKSPSFMLLCTSGFLTMLGLLVPFMYITERATTIVDRSDAVWLLSTIGIANTIGRILCGFFSSFPRVDALLINNLALMLGGISTLISGISLSMAYQHTYSVLFGFSLACFASLRSIVIVELLGLEKLTNAFGILLLFQGFASTIGTPIAAIIKEVTNDYNASFYFSGSLFLISGIILFPLRAINKWENRIRKGEEEEERV